MVTQFASAAAFRASIERRLRDYATAKGLPVVVIRRQAALERLMVRLMEVARGRWALKGGLALETRLGERARASMDMDIDHAHGVEAARRDVAEAVTHDLGDHFSFVITESAEIPEGGGNFALSFRIECQVARVLFEMLQVDVTIAPSELWEVERAERPGLLASVGLGPIEVLLVPLERQIAEKLHAYTRLYGKGRRSTRPRDLIDLVLIRLHEGVDAQRLRAAIDRTFAARKTHDVPTQVPPPPADWDVSFRREAGSLNIPADPGEAYRLVATWLEPVLTGNAQGRWDSKRVAWR